MGSFSVTAWKAGLATLALVTSSVSSAQSVQTLAEKIAFEYCPLFFNSDSLAPVQAALARDGFVDVQMDVVNPRFGTVKSYEVPAIGDKLMVRIATETYFCQILLSGNNGRAVFSHIADNAARFPYRLVKEASTGDESGKLIATYRARPFQGHSLFVQFLDGMGSSTEPVLTIQMAIVPEEE